MKAIRILLTGLCVLFLQIPGWTAKEGDVPYLRKEDRRPPGNPPEEIKLLPGTNHAWRDYSYQDLSNLYLSEIIFDHALLFKTNFSDATLTKAIFTNAKMARVILQNATLTEADFTEAILGRGIFIKALLAEAKFNQAIAPHADFTNATLTEAILQRGDFSDAKFTDANLTRARMDKAIVLNVDFTAAILRDTDLREVRWLHKAKFSSETDLQGAKVSPKQAEYLESQCAKGFIVK